MTTAFGLYVHIPFCLKRCPYCAFAVVVGRHELHERYVHAVCAEIHQWRQREALGPLQTVFFGGGTPSLLHPSHLQTILSLAERVFGLTPEAELTLEANPGSADVQKFSDLRQIGFNRLSLGVQAFDDDDLKTLGRRHSCEEAVQAFERARQAGFRNVNLDVIFSIPGSPRAHWRKTMGRILAFRPEHISAYALTLEEGSSFALHHKRGVLQPVSEDDDAWAYEWAIETLKRAGYEHYEVSNFAKPGFRSRHNWGYWHGVPYVGVGLSAHSYLNGTRSWNTTDIRTYMRRIESGDSPCVGHEQIDSKTARCERLWLQLRTSEGVALDPTELAQLRQNEKAQAMLAEALLCLEGAQLRLTPRGFLLADAIGVDLLDILETTSPEAVSVV